MRRPTKVEQIIVYVESLIEDGLEEGDSLPSEQQLMVTFATDRGPVGRALDELVSRGRARRVEGHGLVVAAPLDPESAEKVRLREIERLVRDLFTLEDAQGQLVPRAMDRSEERDVVEIEERLRTLVGMEPPTEPELQHQRDCPHPIGPCDCNRSHLLAEARRLAGMIPRSEEAE